MNTASPIGTFYAYMENATGVLSAGKPLIFDTVVYNSGEYNPQNGKFTAPVSGIYTFLLNLFDDGNSGYVHLLVNNVSAMGVWSYSRVHTGVGSAIVHVNADDEVYVSNKNSNRLWIGQGLSHFSGFLVHADPI